ncbi:MAG: 2-amino-4-hydroxy-6-hydroxymethyldihydropteridine diphosphokinase [Prolixibacteraceae bacterium]|jgi:2-amino-4-hydroxy-6-hydroxymethyldihydropteridine diphosphokinase|nr:2-amino-4-hydroxy-6-hydroxymethyldihydropteridine diphosphokinase [Prolixibacteraceae bacterium]
MNHCIIGIGSNIDAEENIRRAIEILKNDFSVLAVSEMIKTEPIGIKNQPDFTNGAVKIETLLQQNELGRYLKNLEDQLGRDRSLPRFGPRTIDLDIVVWNGQVVDLDYYDRDFLQKSCAQLGFKIH